MVPCMNRGSAYSSQLDWKFIFLSAGKLLKCSIPTSWDGAPHVNLEACDTSKFQAPLPFRGSTPNQSSMPFESLLTRTT